MCCELGFQKYNFKYALTYVATRYLRGNVHYDFYLTKYFER